ncbi:hypothetical protein Taro_032694 [Colocasia esculenta]|uniref:Pentatricopeptide repeat-containing protein n=1 Tax=Colocasia esculenta TaxID=4460 RepID=A0A843VRZ2_COLES|nr:hypothetical protein [Colocasia esculenta]
MPARDVVSWNSLISGFAHHGLSEQALLLHKRMVFEGVTESPSTFSSVLGVCSNAGFFRKGEQVHSRVFSLGFESNSFVGSALVDLYMRFGLPQLALRLFAGMREQSMAACNSILCGFSSLGLIDEQVMFFSEMRSKGIEANGVSFSYLLRGCCHEAYLWEGKQLHCHVLKVGLAPGNLFVSNALVDFYSTCGSLVDARSSIELIPIEDVISWNSIIAVNADSHCLLEALELFWTMLWMGKKPSVRSLVGLLNSSSRKHNLHFGVQIHGLVLKSGFDHSSFHVRSALIDMYGKCRDIKSSVSLFNEASEKSLECCNSLITSLLHCNALEDAVEMFGLMSDEGVRPDRVTFSAILRALSSSMFASVISCGLLHCWVIKLGFGSDMVVSCSLISAYSRCGSISASQRIFRDIAEPNLVCFTAIITGYARNGLGRECIEMLDEMIIKRGIKPDGVTFLTVLAGCDHSGMIDEGRQVFKSMRNVHGVEPDQRHYSCMASLLGRAGSVEEAIEFIENAPASDNPTMWSALLQSCRIHGNEEVGKRAAKALMDLEFRSPAACMQVSSFYSEIADIEMSVAAREMLGKVGSKRVIGCSLIEVNDGHCTGHVSVGVT